MKRNIQSYAKFFETLSAENTLSDYEVYFDSESTFEDPFQKVKGISNIYKIFEHMYQSLHEPSFVVEEIIRNDTVAYLRWNFYFKLSKNAEQQSFVGVSRVELSSSGKVISHIDYWDAAFNIYEKIPLIGSLLRVIKRRLHV